MRDEIVYAAVRRAMPERGTQPTPEFVDLNTVAYGFQSAKMKVRRASARYNESNPVQRISRFVLREEPEKTDGGDAAE